MLFKAIDWICCRLGNAIMFLLSLWLRRNEYDFSPSKDKKHVLVLANDLLGDALVRMPFYVALRRAFPPETHHIAVMLTPSIAKFLSPLPFFDEIIVSRHLCCAHFIRWIFSRRQFVDSSLRWALVHRTDICLNPFRFRSLGHDYILKLTKPSVSVAYKILDQARVFPASAECQKKRFDGLYTHLLSIIPNVSQLDEMHKMLSLVVSGACPELVPVSQSTIESILDFRIGKSLARPYVVIVPGAGAEQRRWPVDRFAQVACRLGGNVVVVGTKDEDTLGRQIPGAVNLCGKTSLSELGGVLASASLVITNETGAATYAAVLGVRTLCLVGGGDFKAFFPNDFYKNTRSIYHSAPCFSCRWLCSQTSLSCAVAPCIDSIGVDEVYAVAKEMLDESCRTTKGNI